MKLGNNHPIKWRCVTPAQPSSISRVCAANARILALYERQLRELSEQILKRLEEVIKR